jgi:exonuclease SbcD
VRLLHTSDWHLGASIKQVDCGEEQWLFLNWLVETLEARAIEVLVVAGDIFHYSSPSNAARQAYFRFLHRCTGLKSLRKVVVVAGNHDSASGLEAPRELLDLLNVHVVGALPRDEARWGECLAPIEGDDGEVELVVAAVPYVQEARLGVSLGEGGESELREQYRSAFRTLYERLADEAETRWPGANLVATGHLTVYGDPKEARRGDFHSGIHRTLRPELRRGGGLDVEADIDSAIDSDVANDGGEAFEEIRNIGSIDAMDPGIFDPRYRYVALGHIHRPMPVGGARHIRYSGSPVATSVDETTPARRVLQVDIETDVANGDVRIESVPVPRWREIFEIRAGEAEIDEILRTLQTDAPLAPAVFIKVLLGPEDVAGTDRLGRFQTILKENHPAERVPVIVELREQREQLVADGGEERARLAPIEELTNLEVFEALYRRKYPASAGPSKGLVARFREIEQLLMDVDEGGA